MGCCGSTAVVQEEEREGLLNGNNTLPPIKNNFCFKCGGRLHPGSQFCPACGATIPPDQDEKKERRKEEKEEEEEPKTADKLKEEWKKREDKDRMAKLKKEEDMRRKFGKSRSAVKAGEGWREKEARLQKEREEMARQREEKESSPRSLDERPAGPTRSQSAIFGLSAAEKRTKSILGEDEQV